MKKKQASSSEQLRYRRFFETSHLGILILDCDTRKITDANPFITKLTGYSPRQLIGKKISQVRFFDDKITGKQIFRDLEKDSDAFYENIIFLTKTGQKKIVDLNAHTYTEGDKTMVQCTVRDITEKRKYQRELFETTQRLEALMNALPVGVSFSLDRRCEHITGNPYLLRKMEMRVEDNISVSAKDSGAAGKKLRHFLDGRRIAPREMPMQRAITEKRVVGPLEIEVELPSGRHWLMEAIGAPVRDKQGKVIGAVAVNVDLTERKKAEEAEKLEVLIEQEKLKLDFIADAAHELRTPLAIIRGNVDLALRTKSSAGEALKAINVEVLHLADLLSDLSLLTTKESVVKRKIATRKVELSRLISNVVKRHRGFAHKKSIAIHLDSPPKVRIVGDQYYLERLFSNLIANAISYGKNNGDVWISGKKDAKSIHISVSDNGIGIPPKDLPHIFERFYRTDSSRSKDTGGSGLGLAIVEWIAETHGGKVVVSSTEAKGSTFTVSLPLVKKFR